MASKAPSIALITSDELVRRINYHLRYSLMKDLKRAAHRDLYYALGLSCRELLIDRMLETEKRYSERKIKRLYYISIEYLLGRSLLQFSYTAIITIGDLHFCTSDRPRIKSLRHGHRRNVALA